jgi:hypothetical protein
MAEFRKIGEKTKYNFRDKDCIGRKCWSPGTYYHRGATSGGSRATGDCSYQCLNRAYRGCPGELIIDKDLIKIRKTEGWKQV